MNTTLKTKTVSATQYKAAKAAGYLFLSFIVISILHFMVIELNLLVSNNMEQVVTFIKSNELLFRFGIIIDLLLFTIGTLLYITLYILLKPVNKYLTLLALFCMSIQTVVAIVIEFSSFGALILANNKSYLAAFDPQQLQALLGITLQIRADAYNVVMLFFDIGFILFSYLFLRAKYIPNILALWGIFAYTVLLIMTLLKILKPQLADIAIQVSASCVMLFQIALGLWLLTKGVNAKFQTSHP